MLLILTKKEAEMLWFVRRFRGKSAEFYAGKMWGRSRARGNILNANNILRRLDLAGLVRGVPFGGDWVPRPWREDLPEGVECLSR